MSHSRAGRIIPADKEEQMKYVAEMRTYTSGEYSEWEPFDGFEAENEDSDAFYDAAYYIREAVEGGAEIAEMVSNGDIEDFQIRILDEDGREVSCEWAEDVCSVPGV